MTARPDISRRALRDQVYDRILAMLLAGEIEAGERLSIDTMARDLAVSPTPVREAMVQLERTGLVTREALKGYRVAPPLDGEQLDELFDARLALEVAAAGLAARHADELVPAMRAAQERHVVAGQAVLDEHDAEHDAPLAVTQRFYEADRDVHRLMFEHAHNRYLSSMYDDLAALTHRMRQSALHGPDDVHEATAEHWAIIEAFERGERDAVAAVRRHIENVRARSLAS